MRACVKVEKIPVELALLWLQEECGTSWGEPECEQRPPPTAALQKVPVKTEVPSHSDACRVLEGSLCTHNV